LKEAHDIAGTPENRGNRPLKRQFTKRFDGPRLSVDAAARQGAVTRLAVEKLGAAAAILFLNGDNATLQGRPLAIAVASEDGLRSVRALIAQKE
jgi:hypothetical protein